MTSDEEWPSASSSSQGPRKTDGCSESAAHRDRLVRASLFVDAEYGM